MSDPILVLLTDDVDDHRQTNFKDAMGLKGWAFVNGNNKPLPESTCTKWFPDVAEAKAIELAQTDIEIAELAVRLKTNDTAFRVTRRAMLAGKKPTAFLSS